MPELIEFELSKEFLERFEQALENKEKNFIIESLENVKPADITALLHEFDTEKCKYVFDLLPPEVDANVLIELEDDERAEFIRNFDNAEVAEFLDTLDSDDGADILLQLPQQRQEEVIGLVESEEKAGYLLDLMRYDEDVAGGLMAKELIKAKISWTVTQTIEAIRKQAENVQKIFSIYVVDDNDKLLGKVSLKKIILSSDNIKIKDLYDEDLFSVDTLMSEREVAIAMQKYDLEAVPVINARGKLVGRITIDDIIDVITEIAEEERQLMTGISSDVDEDDTVWTLSKARLPWLIIGMVGGLLAAQITDLFSGDMTLIAGLALFIPLIMATGGNVGIHISIYTEKTIFITSWTRRHTSSFPLKSI